MPRVKIGNFNVDGVAVSGVGSALALVNEGICLDIGTVTSASLKCGTVLITHGHIDHCAGIVQHASIRAMQGSQKTRYVVPCHLEALIRGQFKTWADMQEGEDLSEYVELVPLAPGEKLLLKKNTYARAFSTHHRVPSQGYVLSETKDKLLPEFAATPGPEIGRLRQAGVKVTERVEQLRLAYTGDTKASVFDAVPDLSKVDLLITESTFIGAEQPPAFAQERGHTHLNEIWARAEQFGRAQEILLVHFSARYANDEVQSEIENFMPQALAGRLALLPI